MTQTKTSPAPKSTRAPKDMQAADIGKKAAKPTSEKYAWNSKWKGPSTEVNKNDSRTKIDPAKFNAFPKANVTERDQAAIVALRGQFGGKAFARRNMDAGIIRRLMERGLVSHKSGDPSALDGMFALTKAGLGAAPAKVANG